MRRHLALALGLGLLLAAFAPAAAEETERGRDDGSRRESGDDHAVAKGPRVGQFRQTASASIAGEFVSFQWSATGITGFTVNGTELFDVAAPTGDKGDGDGARITGSVIKVEGDTYELLAHDNPMGVLKFQADGRVTMTLAAGATVAPAGQHLIVSVGAVSGRVFGDDIEHHNGTITADGDLRFMLAEPIAHFDSERGTLARATAEKKIGAEVSFAKDKRKEVLSFGNVTARVLRSPDEGARDIVVQVEGHGFEGRVIVLNVDGSLFGATKADRLDVQFDNETIFAAKGGLEDVLNPDDDGLTPEYWLGFDVATGGFQLVVSVPHYSVHEIRVANFLAEAPPSVVIGVVAGVAAIAAAAVVMFRPRRAD